MDYGNLCKRIDTLYLAGERGDALFGAILQLAMHRLNDDDAAQDAVIEVLTGMGGYKPIAPFNAWVNRIISRRRFGLIRDAIEANKGGEPGIEIPFRDAPRFSPDFSAIDNPFVRKVAMLIANGCKQVDISRKLQVSPGAMRQRLFYYRRKMEGATNIKAGKKKKCSKGNFSSPDSHYQYEQEEKATKLPR